MITKEDLSSIHEGYVINPNEKVVSGILRGLERNNGHCPCQVEASDNTLCPCVKYKTTKDCCCFLYVPMVS